MSNIKDLVQDVVASPLGDIIASVGQGVAEAQQALDEASLQQVMDIYSEGGDQALEVLRSIGYKPTFYAIPETTGEIKIALALSSETSTKTPASNASVVGKVARSGRKKPKLYGTPVDASYANKYGFQSNISASVSFKIVAVPAPEGMDDLRLAPYLIGTSIADAETRLSSLGLQYIIVGKDNKELISSTGKEIITKQSQVSSDKSPIMVSVEDVIQLGL